MNITEAGLRRVIRSMLVEQDTGQTAASPTADQAHKQLESQPVNDANLMVKGGAVYQETVKRFPAAKAGIDRMFSEFDAAKRRRLDYLESQFPARYKALKEKLGDKADVDVNQLQGAMIYRVRRAVLKLGTYGTDIKPNGYGVKAYEAAYDPTSGWAKTLGSLGKRTSVSAFAPASDGSVVSSPPNLLLDDSNNVTGTFDDREIGKILEHELIHQEDYAASIILVGDASTKAHAGQAASLSRDLIIKSMIPADQLTADVIRQRLNSSPALAEEIRLVTYLFPNQKSLEQPAARETADILVVSHYASALTSAVDTYKIIYYQIAAQFPVGKNLGDPDAAELFKLDDNIGEIIRRNRDMTLDSHLRITLSLMLPHLQAALAENPETGAAIEATLKSMEAAGLSEDKNRAAHILAITDPKKLADLTMVALGGQKQKGATGSSADRSALAENVWRKWSRIAGLV